MENNHSAILYGVPRVAYGQDGCTPFPMCILSCARYLGIPVDYARAMAESGAAFRLVWDTSCWNGGNVDAILSFDSPDQIFLCGMRAMERDLKILKRTPDPKQEAEHFPNCSHVKQRMPGSGKSPSVQKEDFMAFIRNEIDQGNPVIALGIIGPPEACVIAGYRENGNLLLGWNVFQEYPEYRASVTFDKNGYFITGDWWENPETIALIATGTKPLLPFSLKEVLANATEALRGRMCGTYAKGTLAYDAWKNALLCDRDFPRDAVFPVLVERMMCHGDAMDCLSDGRMNAAKYLRQMAEQYPLQAPGLKKAAAEFEQITKILWEEMIPVLGGWERGEKQIRQLARPETRRLFAAQIERMKTHDERALACLCQLAEAE